MSDVGLSKLGDHGADNARPPQADASTPFVCRQFRFLPLSHLCRSHGRARPPHHWMPMPRTKKREDNVSSHRREMLPLRPTPFRLPRKSPRQLICRRPASAVLLSPKFIARNGAAGRNRNLSVITDQQLVTPSRSIDPAQHSVPSPLRYRLFVG